MSELIAAKTVRNGGVMTAAEAIEDDEGKADVR